MAKTAGTRTPQETESRGGREAAGTRKAPQAGKRRGWQKAAGRACLKAAKRRRGEPLCAVPFSDACPACPWAADLNARAVVRRAGTAFPPLPARPAARELPGVVARRLSGRYRLQRLRPLSAAASAAPESSRSESHSAGRLPSPVIGASVMSSSAGAARIVNAALAVPVLETMAIVCLPAGSVSR